MGRSPHRRRDELIPPIKSHCSLHSHRRIVDSVPQASTRAVPAMPFPPVHWAGNTRCAV
jgi:hypothetical protein